MKIFYCCIIFLSLILNACSTLRESAGVTRKSVDEFTVIENPPLIIPPDFNLLPPDQLKEKEIGNIDKELAEEILFGLEDKGKVNEVYNNQSTMNQILAKTDALKSNSSIRKEIDENFAQEIDTKNIFNLDFENEIEVLDAVKESERIRKQKFDGESISGNEIPVKKEKVKKKKKKRFFLF
tara:strand:+ start:3856 stop:4398 length:543 start_codon:yes stop_codon:yes gene_type:complete